jgi:hypothetical protein
MDPWGDLRTGALKDPPDTRDFALYTAQEAQELQLPDKATSLLGSDGGDYILKDRPPVYNQYGIGSCTANATCAALRFAYKKSTGEPYEAFEPSRLFTYYVARTLADPANVNGTNAPTDEESEKDLGSNSRNAIYAFVHRGILQESFWPYGEPSSNQDTHIFDHLETTPNPNAAFGIVKPREQLQISDLIMNAKKFFNLPDNVPPDVGYHRIYDTTAAANMDSGSANPSQADWDASYNMPPITMLEKTLDDGFPFVFSIRLYKGLTLTSPECFEDGYIYKRAPPNLDQFEDDGGHAVLAVGYSRTKRAFLVQNSWGEGWGIQEQGLKGCFWLPYNWFEVKHSGWAVTHDFWVIKVTVKS